MKNLFQKIVLMTSILSLFGCNGNNNPATWSESKTEEWFKKGEWRNGWKVYPDNSIDKKAFAVAYFKNKERWNGAFSFLKNTDLSKLEVKRHDVDGNNLYATITEYNTKNIQDARFEAHRKYIDIQYVVNGKELIGVAPLASKDSVLQEYDAAKDIEFLKIKDVRTLPATPDNFFIFFPADAHMPGLKTDTISPVRKVVVKVLID
jgi:YhcH/YjgK/YiaL family protein